MTTSSNSERIKIESETDSHLFHVILFQYRKIIERKVIVPKTGFEIIELKLQSVSKVIVVCRSIERFYTMYAKRYLHCFLIKKLIVTPNQDIFITRFCKVPV